MRVLLVISGRSKSPSPRLRRPRLLSDGRRARVRPIDVIKASHGFQYLGAGSARVSRGDQIDNARVFAKEHAAKVIEEEDLERVVEAVERVLVENG